MSVFMVRTSPWFDCLSVNNGLYLDAPASPTETPPSTPGWDIISMDNQLLSVRTLGIEEKCQALETMLIHASTLGSKYGMWVSQSLEVALGGLKFYFHDGVREACAM